MRSRVTARVEQLSRLGDASPPPYRKRLPQPVSRQAIPADLQYPSPSPAMTPPMTPTAPPPPSPYQDAYDEIPDSALSGLSMEPPDTPPEGSEGAEGTGRVPAHVHTHHFKGLWDGCSQQFVQGSFPDSPAPTVPPTPDPTDYSYPCAYPASYTPEDRDHDCDLDAVMIAVNDLNAMTRHLRSGREFTRQLPNPTGVPTTRADVVEALNILKFMVNRLFARYDLEAENVD